MPNPENIMAFATDHLAHQLPAVAGPAYDLLDRRSVFRQGQDHRIGNNRMPIAVCVLFNPFSNGLALLPPPACDGVWCRKQRRLTI
jgi:hypothetical protein